MEIRTTIRYLKFRALLSNRELDNFRAVLSNLLFDRKLEDGPRTLVLRGPKPFRIVIHRRGDRLWLLAGHWERHGEPTQELERYLVQAHLRLDAGAAPDDDL